MPSELDPSTHIAIIGMAGKFPGAGNVGQYWQNLRNGVESIRQLSVFTTRLAPIAPAEGYAGGAKLT